MLRAAGKRLYVWTVNDAESLGRMLDLGVDALVTNYPRLAMQVRTLPAHTPHTAAYAACPHPSCPHMLPAAHTPHAALPS